MPSLKAKVRKLECLRIRLPNTFGEGIYFGEEPCLPDCRETLTWFPAT